MEAKLKEAMEASPQCPVCSLHTTKFKYFNNKNKQQPRYHCSKCDIKFTVGDFGRKKPQHYKKKRNQDPEEFKDQVIVCSHCHEVGNSRFKYYNNKATCGLTQPRFECLNGSCNKQFPMLWDGVSLVPNKKGKSKVVPHESLQRGDQPCILSIPSASASCSHDVMVSYVQQEDPHYSTYNYDEVPVPMGDKQLGDPYSNIYDCKQAPYEVCAAIMGQQQGDPNCNIHNQNQVSYEMSAPTMGQDQFGQEQCDPAYFRTSNYINQPSYEMSAPTMGQGHFGQGQCDPVYWNTSNLDNQPSYEVSAPIMGQGGELQYSYTQAMMDVVAFYENAATPCESELVGRDAEQAVDHIWNVEDVIRGIMDSASGDDANAAASAWEVEVMNYNAQSTQANRYAAGRV